jgi:hypothetical protein
MTPHTCLPLPHDLAAFLRVQPEAKLLVETVQVVISPLPVLEALGIG